MQLTFAAKNCSGKSRFEEGLQFRLREFERGAFWNFILRMSKNGTQLLFEGSRRSNRFAYHLGGRLH
jgi:hypothetical protein